MKPLTDTSLILLVSCSTVCCSLNYYTSILFVLHKCRNFFSVAHFRAAILVLSARFGAASCCCNFAFCTTTYVRRLSHLSPLALVTFVFFILRCNLLFFINSCAFSYCLSFLLPDEASGRNVVNSTLFRSTVCCSLNYYTSILFVLYKCRNLFSVGHFGAGILVFSAHFGAASCCCNIAFSSTTYVGSLSHLSLLFSPFSAFVTFVFFRLRCHLSFLLLSPLSLFINSCAISYCRSFLLPDEASGRNVVNSTVCCSTVWCCLNYYTSILFVLHKCRNFSVAHLAAAILVFSARSGDAPCCCNFTFCSTTYVRPLSHLSLLAFVTFVSFTLRCNLSFILLSHLFFYKNSCAFSYCLSFLLPDETSGRNVVNSTVCCSTVCCFLN